MATSLFRNVYNVMRVPTLHQFVTGVPTCQLHRSAISNVRISRGDTRSIELKTQEPIKSDEDLETKNVIEKVNHQIGDKSHGRLFCVIHIRGHQHKITTDDLLMINDDLGAAIGDKIVLDKVLLVGSKDFTLLGRPMLPRDLVKVDATIVEKNLSHSKVCFLFRKRKNFRRTYFNREYQTTVRINNISFTNKVGETEDYEGFLGKDED